VLPGSLSGSPAPPGYHQQLVGNKEYAPRIAADLLIDEDDWSYWEFFCGLIVTDHNDLSASKQLPLKERIKASLNHIVWELGTLTLQRTKRVKEALHRYSSYSKADAADAAVDVAAAAGGAAKTMHDSAAVMVR
jgi:hypothetical protein